MDSESPARDSILDAAERLFARQGFAATTIKQIGAEAGVNSALLYYYFGDKERLYHATLHRVFASLGAGARLLDPALPPADQIRRFVAFQAEFLIAAPHRPALIVRELLDHDAAHAAGDIAELATGPFKRLCDLVEAGQKAGSFRGTLDPRFAAISIIAQVAYFMVARPAVGLLLGVGTGGPSPDTTRAFGRHAAEFALGALLAPGTRPEAADASALRSSR